jgi:hypothetical protein
VIECDPTASVLVVNVAIPPDNVPVPNVTVPSRNVTVPEGLPAPGATTVTVAVKVTLCPTIDGFRDEVMLVVVLALLTAEVNTPLVLPLKFVSPAYEAVIEWDPTASALVVNVAVPPDNVPVPSVTVPSRNVTVPDGLPAPGATTATVAVKVTD